MVEARNVWSNKATMKNLPLNALRAFAAVYANGGMRAAARELSVVHSSVSRHLGELSSWLGVTLVHGKTGRGAMTFTPQGEALGKALLGSFKDIERVLDSLREARHARTVTLSSTPSFASRWLLSRLPAFERAHPGIELSVLVDQRVTDDLEAAGVDLAVRMGRGPWAGVHCEPLMSDELYPVISPSGLAASHRLKHTADLAGVRLLHDRDPQAAWSAWRDAHGPKALDVRAGPRFASSDLVLRAAVQGQGVALARHRLACEDVASGALVRPFGTLSVVLPTSYWVVVSRAGQLQGPIASVLSWLRNEAARGDDGAGDARSPDAGTRRQ